MRRLGIGVITVAMLAGSALGVTGQDETPLGPSASLEMHSIEGRHTATLLIAGVLVLTAPWR